MAMVCWGLFSPVYDLSHRGHLSLPHPKSLLPLSHCSLHLDPPKKQVRRQFNTINGLMEGTARPDYSRCVQISTDSSLREMIPPGEAVAALTSVGFVCRRTG